MKLEVGTKSFTEAVAWVSKTLDFKSDKTYIALVVNAEGEGYLSHTNGLSYIKSPIVVEKIELDENETEVKLSLDAMYVKRFASTLRDHTAPLSFSKDLANPRTSLTVKRPQENYTIPLVEVRIGEAPDYEVIGSVSDAEYFDTVTRLARLADPASAGILPVIGTVDVKLDQDAKTITVMATDRYALGEIVIPFVPASGATFYGEARNLLIPEERAAMIAPSKGVVDNIELIFEKKSQKFGYAFPDGRIALFALSTAEPLAYSVIKKSASKTEGKALLSLTELKNAITAISSLAYNETNIQLTLSSKGLIVSDIHETNTLRVVVEESTEIEEPIVVRFNRTILNTALSPISTNRLNLKWADANSAFILEPVFDDGAEADNVFLLAIPERS